MEPPLPQQAAQPPYAPPQQTDAQRAQAEVEAAQGRYTQDQQAQQQQAAIPAQDMSPPALAQAPSTGQADDEMAALYAAGQASYQKFTAGGYEQPSMDPSQIGKTDEFGLSGIDALEDVRKRMCRLAPYTSASRQAEFLEDYWRLNMHANDEATAVQYGPSHQQDQYDPPVPDGYTWGSDR